jgi:hypothetical protein
MLNTQIFVFWNWENNDEFWSKGEYALKMRTLDTDERKKERKMAIPFGGGDCANRGTWLNEF